MQNHFTPSTIRQRLGLADCHVDPDAMTDNEPTNQNTQFCEGKDCTGCKGYQKTPNGKCLSCNCDFIDHPIFSDEEMHFDDDEYESEYGGFENW